jgi:hypothetical protein
MTLIGLILLVFGLLGIFVGIILVCFKSSQKAGLNLLLISFVSLLIGGSICAAFPFRIH